MDAPSFEANLLFRSATPTPEVEGSLETDLALLAEAHEMALCEVPTQEPQFRLFDFGALQILIAHSLDPLDPGHFLEASRPAGAALPDTEILTRLTGHQAAVTVLVADNPDLDLPDTPARRALRHRLCWQLTESLRADCAASLVFWCDNDTLYGSEEFERANLFGGDETANDEATDAAGHILDVKDVLEAKALTFMQTQIIQGVHRSDAAAPDCLAPDCLAPGTEPVASRRWMIPGPISRLLGGTSTKAASLSVGVAGSLLAAFPQIWRF